MADTVLFCGLPTSSHPTDGMLKRTTSASIAKLIAVIFFLPAAGRPLGGPFSDEGVAKLATIRMRAPKTLVFGTGANHPD
jgi:hypothetical protein